MTIMIKYIAPAASIVCLSFSTTTFAETSDLITLYGVIDAGITYDDRDSRGGKTGVDSGIAGQSRLGIKGAKALDDKIDATYRLEAGITTDDGMEVGGRLFGRWATVGIKSEEYGSLNLGRQNNLGYSWSGVISSPFSVGWSLSGAAKTFGYRQGDFGVGGRMDNSILYTSPVYSGLQAAVGYSFSVANSESFGSDNNDRVLTSGLRYSNDGLRLAATYEQLDPSDEGLRESEAKNLQVAGSYDFGVARIHAGYNKMEDMNFSAAPGFSDQEDNAYIFGASIPYNSSRFMGAFQTTSDSNVEGYALAYQYRFSSNTFLYALFSDYDTENHDSRITDNRQLFGVGLQHSFSL